jgi:replicative DNA helicase
MATTTPSASVTPLYGSDSGNSTLASLKLPQHSIEAEQSVLGGLMLNNEAWERIGDMVAVEDFYRDDHRKIFRAISKLIEGNKPADALTVAEGLQLSGELQGLGGIAYLQSLLDGTPSAANIRLYAEIVRERAIMRHLARVGEQIADIAYAPAGREARQLLDEAEKLVFDIAEMGRKGGQNFQSMSSLLAEVMERLDELAKNPSSVTGVSTGFKDLDELTSGFHPGDLIIVAGRPSMGKAQPLDAKVKTRHAWKRMAELQVGDALASTDGTPSQVTGIFPQGQRQVYAVNFSDGRRTECCDEHLWTIRYREWSAPRTVTTARLREMLACKRYRNRLWIDTPSGDFGHVDPLPLDPWVLGALLGDGTLVGITPRFSTAEPAMLARLQSALGEKFRYSQSGKYDWRIAFDRDNARAGVALAESKPDLKTNPLKKVLETLGVYGLHSEEKFVPQTYMLAQRSARLALLQGLLDTDGWVEKWGSVRYSSASWRLANDVATLARSLGAHATLSEKQTSYTYEGESRLGRRAFVVNISHANPRELFTLAAKQDRLPERFERTKRLTVASIVPTRVTETQCIAVSHASRLYLTDDYIATHNTAFSLNIAEHVALVTLQPVFVFSMEMGGSQLAARLLSSVARVDQQKVRTGRLENRDWDQLNQALIKLNEAPIQIDETPGLNALELRARARRMHRQYGGAGLIIVDYLQLMSATSQNENRATEISEISRSLKSLAKELKVPVIALSQLNRSVESRDVKKPVMSDLRESGAIEQDADVILFLYRDEVYAKSEEEKEQLRGKAEVIIAKQRNGPIGTVSLTFRGQFTRFENAATGSY